MQPGDVIDGRYRLERELGAGGIGVVWEATDLEVGRPVAMKFLKEASRTDLRRFEVEARALARLRHSGCVAILDFARSARDEPYLVMELLSGESLASLRGRPQPIPRVLSIVRELLSVLAYVHGEGITHRDLKPENVWLDGDRVKVLDFGLAKLTGAEASDITKTGQAVGTPAYMSPEQLRGSRAVDSATDLYALGVMTFELLEGRLPFTAETLLEMGIAHIEQQPPLVAREDCPQALRDFVARSLAKDPASRGTAAEALAALEPPRPARRLTVGLGLALGFGALLAATVVLVSSRDVEQPAPAIRSVPSGLTKTDAPSAKVRAPEPPPPCVPLGPGRHARSSVVELRNVAWVAQVPQSRSPDGPFVFFLHHDRQNPPKTFDDTGLAAEAQTRGWVLLGLVTDAKPWRNEETDLADLYAVAEATAAALCVDLPPVFIVGHGTGGATASAAVCEAWTSGIALYSFSFDTDEGFACEDPRPALVVLPRDNQHVPEAGGQRCFGFGGAAMSFTTFERAWSRQNGCGPRTVVDEDGCHVHPDCAEPLVVCVTDGGQAWPGTPKHDGAPAECDSPGGRFPATDRIGSFFQSLTARR